MADFRPERAAGMGFWPRGAFGPETRSGVALDALGAGRYLSSCGPDGPARPSRTRGETMLTDATLYGLKDRATRVAENIYATRDVTRLRALAQTARAIVADIHAHEGQADTQAQRNVLRIAGEFAINARIVAERIVEGR